MVIGASSNGRSDVDRQAKTPSILGMGTAQYDRLQHDLPALIAPRRTPGQRPVSEPGGSFGAEAADHRSLSVCQCIPPVSRLATHPGSALGDRQEPRGYPTVHFQPRVTAQCLDLDVRPDRHHPASSCPPRAIAPASPQLENPQSHHFMGLVWHDFSSRLLTQAMGEIGTIGRNEGLY